MINFGVFILVAVASGYLALTSYSTGRAQTPPPSDPPNRYVIWIIGIVAGLLISGSYLGASYLISQLGIAIALTPEYVQAASADHVQGIVAFVLMAASVSGFMVVAIASFVIGGVIGYFGRSPWTTSLIAIGTYAFVSIGTVVFNLVSGAGSWAMAQIGVSLWQGILSAIGLILVVVVTQLFATFLLAAARR